MTAKIIQRKAESMSLLVQAKYTEKQVMALAADLAPPGPQRAWFIPTSEGWGAIPPPTDWREPSQERPGYFVVELRIGQAD